MPASSQASRRVVHRLLDRRQQRLARVVEAEQVAVLGEELADRDLALLLGLLFGAAAGAAGGLPPARRSPLPAAPGVPSRPGAAASPLGISRAPLPRHAAGASARAVAAAPSPPAKRSKVPDLLRLRVAMRLPRLGGGCGAGGSLPAARAKRQRKAGDGRCQPERQVAVLVAATSLRGYPAKRCKVAPPGTGAAPGRGHSAFARQDGRIGYPPRVPGGSPLVARSPPMDRPISRPSFSRRRAALALALVAVAGAAPRRARRPSWAATGRAPSRCPRWR